MIKLKAPRNVVAARAPRYLRLAVDHSRPVTRGDCLPGGMNELRPCPYVSCRYHIASDEFAGGHVNVRISEAWLDGTSDEGGLDSMEHTCSLDVAELGGHKLDEVGALMGVVRERVRQLESQGLRSIRRNAPQLIKDGPLGEPTSSHHRHPLALLADQES